MTHDDTRFFQELRKTALFFRERETELRNRKEELSHDVAKRNGLVANLREELETLKVSEASSSSSIPSLTVWVCSFRFRQSNAGE